MHHVPNLTLLQMKYELFKERLHREEETAVIKEAGSLKAKIRPPMVEVCAVTIEKSLLTHQKSFFC